MARIGQHSGIDDDTRKRALAFVEKNNKGADEKEYRSDPYGKMTKAELDGRSDAVDEFFVGAAADIKPRAKKFAEDADLPKPAVTANPKPPKPAVTANPKPPKNRVVSKKELEESGLSLRDFLNRERGLTRRGMSKSEAEKTLGMGEKPSPESVGKAKAQLGLETSDRNEDYGNESRRKAEAPKKQDRIMRDTKPAAVNPKTLLPTGMKKGGAVRGWGMARGARKAKMR